jgi:hypothetical protein
MIKTTLLVYLSLLLGIEVGVSGIYEEEGIGGEQQTNSS